MSQQLICPAGHAWQTEAGEQAVTLGLSCPVCGAPGSAEVTGDAALARADLTAAPPFPVFDAAVERTRHDETIQGDGTSPPRVPGFEILGVLGRGGMGVVYKAWQVSLKRTVALKMILGGSLAGPSLLARFQTEAEAVARLQHPNIVQIYEVGQHEGLPYFALEYVDGGSLDQRSAGQPQPPRAAAGLVETIARAMHYAHERGVVHRDLKPANVLLAGSGQSAVGSKEVGSGQWAEAREKQKTLAVGSSSLPPAHSTLPTTCLPTPKISDFGLAKQLETDSSQTHIGAVLGTPQYMAPEQARGLSYAVGPGADIYALGTILYELLTGRPPFRAPTIAQTMQQVLTDEPVAPSRLLTGVPRDLETICLKCLQKESGRRYASANALADDLRRFLDGQPIQARPISALERMWKWAKRRPAAAALIGVSLAALLGLIGVWGMFTVRLREERDVALKEYQRAEANLDRAMRAVDQLLTEVAEEQLANEPRMQKHQRVLLEKALGFYQEFLTEKSDDPRLRHKTALAHKRVADILRKLGRSQEAADAYAEAIGMLSQLIADQPKADYRQQLAECHIWAGEVRRSMDPAKARTEFDQALALQEKLIADFPDQPAYRRDLAKSHYNRGILLKDGGQPAEADAEFQKAIDTLETLHVQFPGDATYQHELARCLLNRGPVHRALGRSVQARETLERARRLYRDLIDRRKDEPAARFELVVVCNSAGNTWNRQDVPKLMGVETLMRQAYRAQAEARHREALLECHHLVADFPSVPKYRNELANTYNSLAAVLFVDDEQIAQDAWLRARDVLADLVKEFPGVTTYEGDLGVTLGNLGWLATRQDRWGDARDLLSEGIPRLQAALKVNPEHPVYRDSLRLQEQIMERGR